MHAHAALVQLQIERNVATARYLRKQKGNITIVLFAIVYKIKVVSHYCLLVHSLASKVKLSARKKVADIPKQKADRFHNLRGLLFMRLSLHSCTLRIIEAHVGTHSSSTVSGSRLYVTLVAFIIAAIKLSHEPTGRHRTHKQ